MRILMTTLILPFAFATTCVSASDNTPPNAPPRLALKQAPRIESALQQSGRYTLTARFAREESAGELREGGDFALIGRFAKTGLSCDAGAIFSNGFEES